MRVERIRKRLAALVSGQAPHGVRERWPGSIPLMVGRAFVRLWASRWPAVVGRLLLLVGLVGQVVLLLAAGYLIDLSIALMDLWLELARKHLELTL